MPTAIEWTDETWNPVIGCSRVSPGCDHCYAVGVVHRGMSPQHIGLTVKAEGAPTDWTGEVRPAGERKLTEPLRWRKPRKVFVNSLSDLFHPDLPDDEIAKVFAVMGLAPQHTFQILTKRPQRMAALMADQQFAARYGSEVLAMSPSIEATNTAWTWPLPNVWLGTSIESDRYSFRATFLRATPAAVRWVSAEPLLGPLPSLDLTGIDWLVVGGESGPGSRPMHPDWARDLRDRCTDDRGFCDDGLGDECCPHLGTRFLFKQWGDWAPDPTYGTTYSLYDETEVGTLLPFITTGPGTIRRVDPAQAKWFAAVTDTGHSRRMARLGKKAAGRELDGRTWDEYPT